MKTNSRKRLLVSSVAMLLVAMLALGTATYAWFTSNKSVTADGMKVKASSAKGLQITGTNGNTWGPAYTFTGTNSKAATLTPVSAPYTKGTSSLSYDKFTKYFDPGEVGGSTGGAWANAADNTTFKNWTEYTTFPTAKASGEAISDTTGAQKFIAYEVGVKSTGEAISNVKMKVSYANDTATADKSADYIRVAVLKQSGITTNITGDQILTVLGSETTPNAISGLTGTAGSKVPSGISAQKLDGTENVTTGALESEVALASQVTTNPQYYTVLVWFEGQDSECVDVNQQVQGNISINFSYT